MNAEDRGKLEAIKDLPRDFLSLKWNGRIAWLIAQLEAAERRAEALEAEVARLRKAIKTQDPKLGGIALVLRGQGSPELSEELRGIADKLREAALAPQAGPGAEGPERKKHQWGTTADVYGY